VPKPGGVCQFLLGHPPPLPPVLAAAVEGAADGTSSDRRGARSSSSASSSRAAAVAATRRPRALVFARPGRDRLNELDEEVRRLHRRLHTIIG